MIDNFGSTVIIPCKVLVRFYYILTLIGAFVTLALDATLTDLETPAGCVRAGLGSLGSLELHKPARSARKLVLLFPFPLSHLLVEEFFLRLRLGVRSL